MCLQCSKVEIDNFSKYRKTIWYNFKLLWQHAVFFCKNDKSFIWKRKKDFQFDVINVFRKTLLLKWNDTPLDFFEIFYNFCFFQFPNSMICSIQENLFCLRNYQLWLLYNQIYLCIQGVFKKILFRYRGNRGRESKQFSLSEPVV